MSDLWRQNKKNNRLPLKAIVLTAMVFFMSPQARGAFAFSDIQIAEAIRKAENSKSHPYGIMIKFKYTTPRQACLNTIRHARRDWDGKGDFIEFLGFRYAPTKNCSNDPKGLNKNWVKNVKYFLKRDMPNGTSLTHTGWLRAGAGRRILRAKVIRPTALSLKR